MSREAAVAAAMAMAMTVMTSANAMAQQADGGSAATLAQAQPAPAGEQRPFDIPPQSLVTALNVFGRQSGIQISIDASIARGVDVQGVSGTMRPEQALNVLLAGTGIIARFTGPRAVMLTRPQSGDPGAMQLDPVQVQGAFPVPTQAMIDNVPPPYAGGQVATGGQLGLLGNRDVMDTPFNQTSYTAKKAQDQQAKTIRDVLIDDPSVRFVVPDGGVGQDAMTIRGFSSNTWDATYGGLYRMAPQSSIMVEMVERVEVLKGPSAMLSGMAPSDAIGGLINLVPKRAPDTDLTQITAGYASSGQFGAHADVARRFGADKQFGVRFNGVFRAGETSVQDNSDQRALAALGLDFRSERVRLSADLGYQYRYIGSVISYLGIASNVPLPWAPDARKNQGQPWGYQYEKDLFGVVRGEIDLTERVTAYAAFGAHDNRSQSLYSPFTTITRFDGTATAFAPFATSIFNTYLTAEAGVRALVDTGPISHEFALVGTSFSQEGSSVSNLGTSFATNIYNPTIVARPNVAMPVANKTATLDLSNLGLADTLSVADKRIQLTVGARLQEVASANFNRTTGAQTSSYDASALSPSVSLVLRPWQNVSVYSNWIQGLQQGIIVGSTFANAGEVFPPFKSTQYEAGVKVDWGKFTTTASFFQISRPFVLTNVATNTQYLGGEQRNQGLELNVFGEPTDGVRLLGGAMFLSPILTQTQGGLTDGWIAPFSPQFNLNLAGEWDLPFVRGLTVNGRVIYTGAQYIDTTWPRRSLPEWTRFDLGARYAFENPGAKGKFLVARFNVENVLDANYWQGGGGTTTLFLGMPRTFRLSLTADF